MYIIIIDDSEQAASWWDTWGTCGCCKAVNDPPVLTLSIYCTYCFTHYQSGLPCSPKSNSLFPHHTTYMHKILTPFLPNSFKNHSCATFLVFMLISILWNTSPHPFLIGTQVSEASGNNFYSYLFFSPSLNLVKSWMLHLCTSNDPWPQIFNQQRLCYFIPINGVFVMLKTCKDFKRVFSKLTLDKFILSFLDASYFIFC